MEYDVSETNDVIWDARAKAWKIDIADQAFLTMGATKALWGDLAYDILVETVGPGVVKVHRDIADDVMFFEHHRDAYKVMLTYLGARRISHVIQHLNR